eukprot:scaffold368622_cov31-Attheya_sp.AAC.1
MKHNDSDDDHSEDDDDDDDDSMEGSLLTPSTYELIGLAPPGTQQVLECGRCLSLHDNGRRRKRDLEQEFANHETTNDDSSPSSSLRCPLRSALHDASKAFFNAK